MTATHGLVGRDTELAELGGALSSGRRLVSLLGPPGMGKTRLALALLERTDGVFCDLSEARDREGIIAAVAEQLELTAPTDDAIARAIAARGPTMFVLDNFEQVVDHAEDTVGAWLSSAPEASFVVTSRRALGLSAERVLALEPLSGEDALRLWAERTVEHAPDYDVADDRATAEEIVRQLDGIPLAIELAAGRMGLLGSEALLRRLEDRFAVLSRGPRDKPERHRALRHAIDEWWALLSPDARRGLAQLGVFRGGFTVDAAESVLDVPGVSVLDMLAELREASFLRSEHGAARRFGLYAAIRDYAAEQRSDDEGIAAERRLATWVLGEARGWLERSERTGDTDALRHLVAERHNLQAVATCEHLSAEDRACAAAALAAISFQAAPIRDVLGLVERGIAEADPAADPEVAPAAVARLLLIRGIVSWRSGDDAGAQPALREAESLCTAHGLEILRARALFHQGASKLYVGRDRAAATALLERAAEVARASGGTRGEAAALGELGMLAFAESDPRAARRHFERALGIAREGQSPTQECIQLAKLSHAAMELGEHEAARRHADETLASPAVMQMTRGHALACRGLSALDQGHVEEARGDLDASYAALVEMPGQERNAAWVGYARSLMLAMAGELDAARDAVGAALPVLASSESVYERPARAFADALDGNVSEGGPASDDVAWSAAAVELHRARAALAAHPDTRERALEALGHHERIAERSIDARIAHRWLKRSLDGGVGAAWRFDPQGAWFERPGDARVPLHDSKVLTRLLAALVATRGEPIDIDSLRGAAWPDERMTEASGRQRVRANIARLRKMGLRDVLRSDTRGYWLDPDALA